MLRYQYSFSYVDEFQATHRVSGLLETYTIETARDKVNEMFPQRQRHLPLRLEGGRNETRIYTDPVT